MDSPYVIDWTFSVAPPIVCRWWVTSKSVGPFWRRRREHTVESDVGLRMDGMDDDSLRFFAKLPNNVLLIDADEAKRLGL